MSTVQACLFWIRDIPLFQYQINSYLAREGFKVKQYIWKTISDLINLLTCQQQEKKKYNIFPSATVQQHISAFKVFYTEMRLCTKLIFSCPYKNKNVLNIICWIYIKTTI